MGDKIKVRKFTLASIILLGINSILGTGIFLLPGKAMALIGPASILMYMVVTIVVLAIAFCFAECASYFERNGAAYLYAKEAFGDFIGFEIGIMKWAVGIIAWATIAVGFLTALEQLIPEIGVGLMRPFLLTTFLSGLGFLNVRGVRNIRFLSNVFSMGKIVPLALFLFFGMFYIESDNFYPLVPPDTDLTAFGAAGLLIFFAFSGFEGLAVAAEEMDNPKRNLPLAIFAIITITAVLYLFTQFIVVGILGPALAESDVPLALAAEKIGGSYGMWMVMICMLISSAGTNLAASFIAPRSGVALAQDGMISKRISLPGKFGTPTLAIIITTVLTIV
ncbi:MAG: amino acid permease, partial [Parachlamydiaceae bacterium]|nr:amino acid permease [Parachlamydiaceae bacterium]